jgi:hypothetical protein
MPSATAPRTVPWRVVTSEVVAYCTAIEMLLLIDRYAAVSRKSGYHAR